ncbi:unnamed protein product, partial [Didymodactylos carnosus]
SNLSQEDEVRVKLYIDVVSPPENKLQIQFYDSKITSDKHLGALVQYKNDIEEIFQQKQEFRQMIQVNINDYPLDQQIKRNELLFQSQTSVKIHGMQYRIGDALYLNQLLFSSTPLFGTLERFYIQNDNIYAYVKLFKTMDVELNLNAYRVKQTTITHIIDLYKVISP